MYLLNVPLLTWKGKTRILVNSFDKPIHLLLSYSGLQKLMAGYLESTGIQQHVNSFYNASKIQILKDFSFVIVIVKILPHTF
jgi:hypothetical protein